MVSRDENVENNKGDMRGRVQGSLGEEAVEDARRRVCRDCIEEDADEPGDAQQVQINIDLKGQMSVVSSVFHLPF